MMYTAIFGNWNVQVDESSRMRAVADKSKLIIFDTMELDVFGVFELKGNSFIKHRCIYNLVFDINSKEKTITVSFKDM